MSEAIGRPPPRAVAPPGGRVPPLALLAGFLALAFAFQGVRGIWEPDEGRYTAVALQMLGSGDWIHPALHHELPHYTKPPLTYWGIAASLSALGRSEAAARLLSSLSFLGSALVVAAIARRLGSARPWLAATVFATSLAPAAASGIVTPDPPLAFFESLGVLGFVASWWGEKRSSRWLGGSLAGLGFGLAFLTKGPPGLLPVAGMLAFAAAVAGWRGLSRAVSLPGLAVFLAVGLPWYLVVFHDEPGLMQRMVSREVVDRMVDPSLHRNAEWYGPIRIYLPILLLGTLPWTVHLLRSAGRARALLRPSGWARLRREDPQTVLLLLWILVPLVVFVSARSRLPLYVLPLFAPIAILLERRGGLRVERPRRLAAALGAWVGLLLLLRLGSGWIESESDVSDLARQVRAAEPYCREIVFVDERPLYSLAFYTGAEVERVAASSSFAEGHPDLEALRDEVAEGEDPRVWAISSREETRAAFRRTVSEAGREAREVARFRDLVLYATEPGPMSP